MTRFELFRQVHQILRSAFSLPLGAVLLVASFTLASTSAVAQFAGPTQLSFVNGWSDAPFGTSHATVEEVNGIVQFRGAIAGGTSNVAFTLPAGFVRRPMFTSPSISATPTRGGYILRPLVW